ncbi:hypothetical protein V8G54_006072 [Vigna mungo]|uniref:Uncharacterized protein n=1 Tax=Vigna mungo TaxID=3915 RepID=A0AAQ3NZA0_VIGMU
MQLRRTVKANNIARSLTIWITDELDVKIKARFLLKNTITNQNINPTSTVFTTETKVANFAPSALPAPSSFATRTPVAPKNASGIMDSQPYIVTQTERASIPISVLCIYPETISNSL